MDDKDRTFIFELTKMGEGAGFLPLALYQRREKMKVNTTENIKHKISDKQIDEIAKKTGDTLGKQERIKVRIPSVPGETAPIECCINGYNYIIRRGQTVELPHSVVELLTNAGIV